MLLYGEEIQLNPSPIVINDNIMVPLRGIVEALGASMEWNDAEQKVAIVKGNGQIELIIGNTTANKFTISLDIWNSQQIDTKETILPTAPLINNGVTYVPLAYIAESFDINMFFDSATQTVNLGLYTLNGTGAYEGYLLLKGYELQSRYNLYFRTTINGQYRTTDFKYEKLFSENLAEKLTINYNGRKYNITRRELYEYFSQTLDFADLMEKLGDKGAVQRNVDANDAVFGKYYDDWFKLQADGTKVTSYYDKYVYQEKKRSQNTANLDNIDIDEHQAEIDAKATKQEIINSVEMLMEETWYFWTQLKEENKGKLTNEWASESELRQIAGLSLSHKLEAKDEWEFYKNYKRIYTVKIPRKIVDNSEGREIEKEINGLRIRIHDGMFAFNVNDLAEKKLIDKSMIQIIPEYKEYSYQRIKKFLEINHPELDAAAFIAENL